MHFLSEQTDDFVLLFGVFVPLLQCLDAPQNVISEPLIVNEDLVLNGCIWFEELFQIAICKLFGVRELDDVVELGTRYVTIVLLVDLFNPAHHVQHLIVLEYHQN